MSGQISDTNLGNGLVLVMSSAQQLDIFYRVHTTAREWNFMILQVFALTAALAILT